MSSKGARSFLLVVMDALFIVAVLDVARLVVGFFGELAGTQVGEKYLELSRYIVFPLGIDPTVTAQGGLFDWDTLVTVAAILIAEAAAAMIRRRA